MTGSKITVLYNLVTGDGAQTFHMHGRWLEGLAAQGGHICEVGRVTSPIGDAAGSGSDAVRITKISALLLARHDTALQVPLCAAHSSPSGLLIGQ